jgi:hypothetical protein
MGEKVMTIYGRNHSPPNAIDEDATVATPSHSPQSILTESSVARLFQLKYQANQSAERRYA